jgi:hypothetical protein
MSSHTPADQRGQAFLVDYINQALPQHRQAREEAYAQVQAGGPLNANQSNETPYPYR